MTAIALAHSAFAEEDGSGPSDRSLVADLSIKDSARRIQALQALLELAAHAEGHGGLLRAGLVPALEAVLKERGLDARVRALAVELVARLCTAEAARAAIVKAPALLKAAAAAARETDPQLSLSGIRALSALCESRGGQPDAAARAAHAAAAEAGGVEPLVARVKQAAALPAAKLAALPAAELEALRAALRGVASLVLSPVAKLEKRGAIAAAAALAQCGDVPVQRWVAVALLRASADERTRGEFLAPGAVEGLLRLAGGAGDAIAARDAVDAVYNLCRRAPSADQKVHGRLLQRLQQAGAGRALVAAARLDADPELATAAAETLAVLAVVQGPAMAKGEEAEALAGLVADAAGARGRSPAQEQRLAHLVHALAALAATQAGSERLACESAALEALLDIADPEKRRKRPHEPATILHAALALRGVAPRLGMAGEEAKGRVPGALARLGCDRRASVEARAAALEALAAAARHDQEVGVGICFESAGVLLDGLIKLARSPSEPDAIAAGASQVFASLARSAPVVKTLLFQKHGMLEELLGCAWSANKAVRQNCTLALLSVVMDNGEAAMRLGTQADAHRLLEIASSRELDPVTRRRALGTFVFCTLYPHMLPVVGTAAAFECLMALVARGDAMSRLAATCLYNLLYSSATRGAFEEADGPSAVPALLASTHDSYVKTLLAGIKTHVLDPSAGPRTVPQPYGPEPSMIS